MGCGGCLGPKKQIVQIYVSLINQIHQEALKVTPSSNLDLYMAIKEKIMKKGFLRKLNEHLSSHRGKIPESLIYNLKTINHKKQIQNRFATIMIADSIIESTYKKINDNQNFKQSTINQSMESSKDPSSISKNQPFVIKHEKSKSRSFPTFPGELTPEINARIDEQYMKMINFLLENQNRMYHRILLSLQNFCLRHIQKIRCETQVWKTIRSIVKNMELKIESSASAHVYHLLLSRLKQNPTQQMRNHQNLQVVIKTWLNSPSVSSPSPQPINANLYISSRQIIKIYINRCLASWDSEFIYEIITKIYDHIEFQPEKFQALENLYDQAVQDIDLKNQFYRGMFNYLLSYISVTHQDIVDKKWFSMALGSNYQHLRSCYKNILMDKVKMQGFKVLNRWITKNYINLEQFVLYSSKSLIFAYSSNIAAYSKSKKVCDIISNQCFKIIEKMSEQSQQLMKKRIVQEFRGTKSLKKQQQILLKLLKQMLYRDRNKQQQLQNYIIPLYHYYDKEIKIQILSLVGFIIQNHQFQDKIKVTSNIRYKFCEFLNTLYENIVINVEGMVAKYQFCCACVSFCKILITKYDKAIIMAFIQNIQHHRTQLNILQNQFYLNYFQYQLSHLLFKQNKVPNQMFKITQKIHPQINFSACQKIQTEIKVYLQKNTQSRQIVDIQQLKKSAHYSQQQYIQHNRVMNHCFAAHKATMSSRIMNTGYNSNQRQNDDQNMEIDSQQEPTSPIKTQNLFFQRKSTITNQSNNNTEVNDLSFEQVIDIINE